MSSLDDVETILTANFPSISEVYQRNLPQEVKSNTANTIALIQSVRTDPTSLGNDTFNSVDRQLELQVFYKLDLDIDPEELEIKILKTFKDLNYLVSAEGILTDPDTYQLYESFYLTKNYINN